MSEVLLAGALVDCAELIGGMGAQTRNVELEDIAISTSAMGLPIVERRMGSMGAALRLSRLGFEAMARIDRLMNITELAMSEIDYLHDGQSRQVAILHSNDKSVDQPFSQLSSLLEAMFEAETEAQARTIWIGGQYRAAAEDLAQNETRTHEITTTGSGEKISIQKRTPCYTGFYSFENFQYAHDRFDGAKSPVISRDVMITGDAAVLLPYDPMTDEVVLIEQIRPAPLARGSHDAWGLEAVAGLIGVDENPRDTAVREAEEEAGLTVTALYDIPPSYQSPGSISQLMYMYIGKVDLSDYSPAIHGLAEEDEDIRTHKVSREKAIELLRSGEVNNAPLQICLYALALDHEKIRSAFA